MKIAIFGGSFNPVHNGHVALATQIADEFSLDKVIVMPTYISPFKKDSDVFVADSSDRIKMCELAFVEFDYVLVSDYETAKKDVSYTYETINYFREKYPNDELFFVMGSDMLLSFSSWKNYTEILRNCSLIASSREKCGEVYDKLNLKANELSAFGKVYIVKTEEFPVSSSEIREKIVNKQDITCYLHENVVEYIGSNNIYNCKGE